LHGTSIIGDTVSLDLKNILTRKIFLLGGNSKREFPNSFKSVEYWKLNSQDVSWHSAADIPVPSAGFACGTIGHTIYVCGGRTGKEEPYDTYVQHDCIGDTMVWIYQY
jgi:hypothetical protein